MSANMKSLSLRTTQGTSERISNRDLKETITELGELNEHALEMHQHLQAIKRLVEYKSFEM
jgi:hypothetical protein